MHVSNSETMTLETLINISKHPKMVGIGETGLDYYYSSYTKEMQIQSMLTHIAARKTKLPLIITLEMQMKTWQKF